MNIDELNAEERIVLVALLERVVAADARVSEEEHVVIGRVVTALGGEAYRAAAVEADRRFHDDEELWIGAPVLQRPAARELIYETLLEAALPGGVDGRESDLLARLARVWHLQVRFAAPHGTR
jgi:hypothetical protein